MATPKKPGLQKALSNAQYEAAALRRTKLKPILKSALRPATKTGKK